MRFTTTCTGLIQESDMHLTVNAKPCVPTNHADFVVYIVNISYPLYNFVGFNIVVILCIVYSNPSKLL